MVSSGSEMVLSGNEGAWCCYTGDPSSYLGLGEDMYFWTAPIYTVAARSARLLLALRVLPTLLDRRKWGSRVILQNTMAAFKM